MLQFACRKTGNGIYENVKVSEDLEFGEVDCRLAVRLRRFLQMTYWPVRNNKPPQSTSAKSHRGEETFVGVPQISIHRRAPFQVSYCTADIMLQSKIIEECKTKWTGEKLTGCCNDPTIRNKKNMVTVKIIPLYTEPHTKDRNSVPPVCAGQSVWQNLVIPKTQTEQSAQTWEFFTKHTRRLETKWIHSRASRPEWISPSTWCSLTDPLPFLLWWSAQCSPKSGKHTAIFVVVVVFNWSNQGYIVMIFSFFATAYKAYLHGNDDDKNFLVSVWQNVFDESPSSANQDDRDEKQRTFHSAQTNKTRELPYIKQIWGFPCNWASAIFSFSWRNKYFNRKNLQHGDVIQNCPSLFMMSFLLYEVKVDLKKEMFWNDDVSKAQTVFSRKILAEIRFEMFCSIKDTKDRCIRRNHHLEIHEVNNENQKTQHPEDGCTSTVPTAQPIKDQRFNLSVNNLQHETRAWRLSQRPGRTSGSEFLTPTLLLYNTPRRSLAHWVMRAPNFHMQQHGQR